MIWYVLDARRVRFQGWDLVMVEIRKFGLGISYYIYGSQFYRHTRGWALCPTSAAATCAAKGVVRISTLSTPQLKLRIESFSLNTSFLIFPEWAKNKPLVAARRADGRTSSCARFLETILVGRVVHRHWFRAEGKQIMFQLHLGRVLPHRGFGPASMTSSLSLVLILWYRRSS